MPSTRRRRRSGGASKTPLRTDSVTPADVTEAPHDPASKDHYSYQEMMDHLRKVRSGSDAQGLKSKKKRRRRTHQPVKVKRRRRMVTAMIFLFGILPVVAFVGGSFLFSYLAYKGEPFRRAAGQMVNAALHVNGEFEDDFEISGFIFKNRSFRATGPPTSVVSEMQFSNIAAKARGTSLFGDAWHIDHLLCDSGHLDLRPISATSGPTPNATAAAPSALPILAAGMGFQSEPKSLNVERISLRKMNVYFATSSQHTVHRIEGLHMVLNQTSTGYFASCDSGTVHFSFWPEFRVENADLTFDKNGRVVIHRALLNDDDGGTCSLVGELVLAGPEPSVDISAEVSNVKIDYLINQETWSANERALGRLSGELRIAGSLLAGQDPPVMTGTIRIPDLSIKNLEILDNLYMACGIPGFKRVGFEVFEAKIRQTAEEIVVHDIFARNPSLLSLLGQFTVKPNQRLEGEFQMGIPDATILDFKGGRPTFFEQKDDGYSWVTFEIGGDLSQPTENLLVRFDQDVGGAYEASGLRRKWDYSRPDPLEAGPEHLYHRRLEDLFEILSR